MNLPLENAVLTAANHLVQVSREMAAQGVSTAKFDLTGRLRETVKVSVALGQDTLTFTVKRSQLKPQKLKASPRRLGI